MKFKQLSDAFHVLSDEELKRIYDSEGSTALTKNTTPEGTSIFHERVNSVEPELLYSFLFGSNKFNDIVGKLSK